MYSSCVIIAKNMIIFTFSVIITCGAVGEEKQPFCHGDAAFTVEPSKTDGFFILTLGGLHTERFCRAIGQFSRDAVLGIGKVRV